jgi:hypothetical protein
MTFCFDVYIVFKSMTCPLDYVVPVLAVLFVSALSLAVLVSPVRCPRSCLSLVPVRPHCGRSQWGRPQGFGPRTVLRHSLAEKKKFEFRSLFILKAIFQKVLTTVLYSSYGEICFPVVALSQLMTLRTCCNSLHCYEIMIKYIFYCFLCFRKYFI